MQDIHIFKYLVANKWYKLHHVYYNLKNSKICVSKENIGKFAILRKFFENSCL